MDRKNKTGKELTQTKDQTLLLPLSGTRKVVRTPTNPFETAVTVEVFVPKEIIARRIQHIFAGPNKDRKADHYLVVWEDYPLEKDYTFEEPEAACSVVKDSSTPTATNSSLIPTASRVSGDISMSSFLAHNK